MKFSLKIATVAGIPIRLHGLFILLPVLWLARSAKGGLAEAVSIAALFGFLFTSVVLHELGHALVARRYGAKIVDIILWPLGGFTRMLQMPELPRPEFFVAIAGPAVNLIILAAAMLLGGHVYIPGYGYFPSVESPQRTAAAGLVEMAAWVNAILGFSNLIPAFPMDGGRALRAALSATFGFLRATEIAVRAGRWLVAAAVILAYWYEYHFMPLLLIGVFVWFQGAQELASVRARYGKHPLQQLISQLFGGGGARREQDAKREPERDAEVPRDLESYRGSMEEFFKERDRRDS